MNIVDKLERIFQEIQEYEDDELFILKFIKFNIFENDDFGVSEWYDKYYKSHILFVLLDNNVNISNKVISEVFEDIVLEKDNLLLKMSIEDFAEFYPKIGEEFFNSIFSEEPNETIDNYYIDNHVFEYEIEDLILYLDNNSLNVIGERLIKNTGYIKYEIVNDKLYLYDDENKYSFEHVIKNYEVVYDELNRIYNDTEMYNHIDEDTKTLLNVKFGNYKKIENDMMYFEITKHHVNKLYNHLKDMFDINNNEYYKFLLNAGKYSDHTTLSGSYGSLIPSEYNKNIINNFEI